MDCFSKSHRPESEKALNFKGGPHAGEPFFCPAGDYVETERPINNQRSHSPCPSTTTSMRATRFFLLDVSGLAALLHLTRTEASTAVSRSAEIGVGAVHAIREPLSTRPRRISLDHDVGAGLVKAIQSSGKATGEHTHLFHTLRCSPPV